MCCKACTRVGGADMSLTQRAIPKTVRSLWPAVATAWADYEVTALTQDSRQVQPGVGFVALAGIQHDARQHIAAAIAAGATVVFAEAGGDWQQSYLANVEPASGSVDHGRKPSECLQGGNSVAVRGVPIIVIANLSHQLGHIAARFYDEVAQALTVVAVTGTNGKTSIANLLAGACVQLGQRAAVIGTLGNGFYGQLEASQFTTPDPLQLQSLLAQLRTDGANLVAMEASSHGLEQGRMVGTRIHTAVFTNLTRDHLDYHGDMAHYAAAKAHLFQWPGLRAAVINADDSQGAAYQALLAADVACLTYSLVPASKADVVAESIALSLAGLVIEVRTATGRATLRSALLGRFNASNLLAVLATLLTLNYSLSEAVAALSTVAPVAGRMQCLRVPGSALAVVDYAHTPDALEHALLAAREHTQGKLWCVFGCGGGRDTGKRPEMGRIAASAADVVVLTSDNPREEDPLLILAHTQTGMANAKVLHVIADRASAIAYALTHAEADDVVLIAGKGHETYQEIKGVRYPFNDVEQVHLALQLRTQHVTDRHSRSAP